jgi:hypothetical protein
MSNDIYRQAFLRDLKALLKRYEAEMWVDTVGYFDEELAIHVAGGGVLINEKSEVPYFDAVLPKCIKGDTEL